MLDVKTLFILLLFLIISCKKTDHEYIEYIENWRLERLENLTSAISWTSLSGLNWLKEGKNVLGSSRDADVKFPDAAPSFIGTAQNDSMGVLFLSNAELEVKDGEVAIQEMILLSDQEENTTKLNLGQYYFTLIERNGQKGIRVWDTLNVTRKQLKGLPYYPIDPELKVLAKFNPYKSPKILMMKNILGMDIEQEIGGYLSFKYKDQDYSIEPLDGGPDHLFLIFADETSGAETYGGGRYLYCKRPDTSGNTFIDFNKAFTPPCGFTAFATCLLPTRENTFDVKIEAGEMYTDEH